MNMADVLRESFPSYGPDWEAAIEYGIDVSLLIENLKLTPTERLEKMLAAAAFHEEIRGRAKGDGPTNR